MAEQLLTFEQRHCHEMIAKVIKENGNLGQIGERAMDGESTAAASSVDTPRGSAAPVGGTRLRLTLGGGSNGVGTNGTTSGAGSGAE